MSHSNDLSVAHKERYEVAAAAHTTTIFNILLNKPDNVVVSAIFTIPLDAIKAVWHNVDLFVGKRVGVMAPGGPRLEGPMESGVGKGWSVVLPPDAGETLSLRYTPQGGFCRIKGVGSLSDAKPTLLVMGVPAVFVPQKGAFKYVDKPELVFQSLAPAKINPDVEKELKEKGVVEIDENAHVTPTATCQRNKVRVWQTTGSVWAELRDRQKLILVMRDNTVNEWVKFQVIVNLAGTKSFTLETGKMPDGRPQMLIEERLERAGGEWGTVGEWREIKLGTDGALAARGPDEGTMRAFFYTAYTAPVLSEKQAQRLWQLVEALKPAPLRAEV